MTNNKQNITALFTELMQFYVSLPNSKEKHELDIFITMMKSSKLDLKTLLSIVQSNTTKEKKQVWVYVLSLFTKYLRR